MSKDSAHLITREIGIDAGHRVTFHGSKCRNVHGHRYTISATCVGPLADRGEEQGMVMDFGFLKEEMMDCIDKPCDHGMIMWIEDPLLERMLGREIFADKVIGLPWSAVGATGKMYIVDFVPTAENLARHWYNLLRERVRERTQDRADLAQLKVQETPNCSATYPVSPRTTLAPF